jgi:DNA repair protein RadA/Sms
MMITEPAADLAVVAAVASSLRNRPIHGDAVVFGEVGLAGEVRATSQAPLRVREAAQLGFTRCIVPDGNVGRADVPGGIELIGVRTVGEALDALM